MAPAGWHSRCGDAERGRVRVRCGAAGGGDRAAADGGGGRPGAGGVGAASLQGGAAAVGDMLMIFLAVVVEETHLNAMVHHRNRPKTMVVVKFCTMLCALSDDHEPDDRAVHRAAQGWLVAKHLSVTAAAAIILLTARITMDFHCGTHYVGVNYQHYRSRRSHLLP